MKRKVHASGVKGIRFDLSPKALTTWNPAIKAESSDTTINILDVIGEDYWTGTGVTAKGIMNALEVAGGRDVVVNINSPGGDMFEGLAINSLLSQYDGEVTVKVLGVAASAASIIAMAGNKIEIAKSGFFMIHNAWVYAAGDRNDMIAVSEYLAPFDDSMADIYVERTGIEKAEITRMMDAETWINGSDAVDKGFADSPLNSDEIQTGGDVKSEIKLDVILAKAGLSRSERRSLIREIKSSVTPRADEGTPRAAIDLSETLTLTSNLSRLLK